MGRPSLGKLYTPSPLNSPSLESWSVANLATVTSFFLACRCDFSLQRKNKTNFWFWKMSYLHQGVEDKCKAVSRDVLEMRRGNIPAIAATYHKHVSSLVLETQILIAMKLWNYNRCCLNTEITNFSRAGFEGRWSYLYYHILRNLSVLLLNPSLPVYSQKPWVLA